jgi:excisionase family DNA binding protein
MTQLDATDAASGPNAVPPFYTAAEVAHLFRLDESTLYRHLRAGNFPGLKVGGRYVVPREVVDRLIADILHTGKCVDIGTWTERWRERSSTFVDVPWPTRRDGDVR